MINKKIFYGVIGALLVICTIAITGAINATGSSYVGLNPEGTNANIKDNTLTVTGLGKVSIKPDVAYLDVGVRTVDKDAKKAQDDNKAIMARIMTKLKTLKIDEKDVQTSAYNIWPRYNYDGSKETLEGYEVENMLRLTIRKVESVGDVLDAVSKEGANRSSGISFGVLDRDTAYKQALEKAIDDAKGKAEVMGKKAGVDINKPLAIHEGNTPNLVYRDDMYNRGVLADMAAEKAAGVPIASGELEIQAYVTIVYQVK